MLDEKTLIARFLRANNYSETLKSFLAEAGLPEDAGSTDKDDLTLERLLQEKRAYDLSVQFEKLGTDETKGWRDPSPAVPVHVETPSNSNLLAVGHVFNWMTLESHGIWSTTADRRINITNTSSMKTSFSHLQNAAPVLSISHYSKFVVYGDMGGNLTLAAADGEKVLDRRKDHQKYIVRIAVYEMSVGTWIATAGWDSTVLLYFMPVSREPTLGEPVGKIRLFSNPESVLLIPDSQSTHPMLLVSRRDSTFLYYYDVPPPVLDQERPSALDELDLLGKQNLAPHALSWVSFTPSDVALCPTDSSLVAVATSSTPHMKVMIVRLLRPARGLRYRGGEEDAAGSSHGTASSILDSIYNTSSLGSSPASVARADIARQDREEAAILISCNTMAPQTQFSTPVVRWRSNGSGVWISGDDGIIRGIEVASGKVVARLEGHEAGSKVRCLWAGDVRAGGGEKQEEWLISGGFDQRLIVWKCRA